MKFADYIKNPTKENLIKFKKYQIEIIKEDLKKNGDNSFGTKETRIGRIKEDIERLENEN